MLSSMAGFDGLYFSLISAGEVQRARELKPSAPQSRKNILNILIIDSLSGMEEGIKR